MSVQHFSTAGLPAELRREAVVAAYGAHVSGSVDFPDDTLVAARMMMRNIGDVHLASVETSPIEITTAPDDTGLLYLSMTLGGAGVIDARGEGRGVRAGDVNVLRRERRCVTVAAEASALVNIALPRALLVPRLASADSLLATRTMADPAARLLQGYAVSLLGLGQALTPEEEAMVSSHLVDLAVMLLGPSRDAAEPARQNGVRAARRRAVQADIAAHLGDPQLSLGWIARRHGLSEAYVRTLFYHEGTSFTDHVLEARLNHVSRMLRDPAHARQTIAALALMAGFGDISWFNQAFRRRYGMTPSDMRALPGAGAGAGASGK